jgi:FKBP-type peptidyl-prolyl cis-trans isomerase FkpA
MNKFRFYFILPLVSIVLFSCSKDDSPQVVPPLDPSLQYPIDIDIIETYLKTHSFEVVEVEGRTDVAIDTFIVGNAEGKVSIWDNTTYPLQSKIVKNDSRITNLVDGRVTDDVDYKMYYLMINEGGGTPATRFDSTFVSYRGWKLNNEQFDTNNTPTWVTFPKIISSEVSLISGFRQFYALLPSGLGYYNLPRTNIPSYSPLIFTVRLHSVRERDHDRDGVFSKYENGAVVEDLYTVDTDGDNIPDFLDIDDDNDNVRTIIEVRNPATGKPFPFADIPTCLGGTLKKHLDPNCQ